MEVETKPEWKSKEKKLSEKQIEEKEGGWKVSDTSANDLAKKSVFLEIVKEVFGDI